MTWRRNPRVITKEQFSAGTTIDGNRIDTAMQDVVDRVNSVPYGDLRKRWVPITYVAGWTPQTPLTISTANPSEVKNDSKLGATHHWPWMSAVNNKYSVVDGTLGASDGDDVVFTNPYRFKGGNIPGVYPGGIPSLGVDASSGAQTYTPAGNESVGRSMIWTRSWFLERPSILESIDLHLLVDHPSISTPARNYTNTFLYGTSFPPGSANGDPDRGLVISAAVDSEFDREDRNMADIEVMRRDFAIKRDTVSFMSLPVNAAASPTYSDFSPKVGQAQSGSDGLVGAGTVTGVHVAISDLNIPIHQNSRLRLRVAVPKYGAGTSGWGAYPWLNQQMNMTVTFLEEVSGG